MPLYLGADDYSGKIKIYFLKSFRKIHIRENLKKKLKKDGRPVTRGQRSDNTHPSGRMVRDDASPHTVRDRRP
jgi:hypothetical protein